MTKQEQIDEIMDNFDFSRVERTMRALGWKWWAPNGEEGIPEEARIRKSARGLLDSVRPGASLASGGFTATLSSENELLSLKFVVDEYEVLNRDLINKD